MKRGNIKTVLEVRIMKSISCRYIRWRRLLYEALTGFADPSENPLCGVVDPYRKFPYAPGLESIMCPCILPLRRFYGKN